MKKFINLFFLLVTTLFINFSIAKSIDTWENKSANDTVSSFDNHQMTDIEENLYGDNYYIVFANYTLVDASESTHNKRQEKEEKQKEFIYSLMNEINNLIVGNIDTYEDPNTVEEIINNEKLRKRNEQNDEDNIGTVIRLTTLNEISILSAYLSEELIEHVKDMSGVYDCMPNRRFNYGTTYNSNDIKNDTKWKSFKVKKADGHLSLISQGKYDKNLVGKYDTNYYYPESNGKDVDIYIIDSSFNFNQKEFDDTNRTVKCIGVFNEYGNYINNYTEKYCVSPSKYEHGTVVADMAGGINHGVATNANIYGIAVDLKPSFASIMASLNRIKKFYLNNKKGIRRNIFNFSFGYYSYLSTKTSDVVALENVIDDLVNNYNAVFFACAYNDGLPVKDENNNKGMYPCILDNVICVGSTNGMYESDYPITNSMRPEVYMKASFSNYGDGVDIYAPGYVSIPFLYSLNYVLSPPNSYWSGTSFSTPIVAGIAASIMSENPTTQFNKETMFNYLKQTGIKNAIEDIEFNDPSNLFANNGKHIVYSSDDTYNGCGINAGNNKCGNDLCCSYNGYCVDDKNLCKIENGCQSKYGLCNYKY
ncbi:subtilisin-like protein [Anaeromyces robustus]|uniref:Subtilisin-like protein n=1 Tax=Anaeromyces robustus TaxID=1754192 RepID=A0A1Y1XBW9_9FUNG|nr:subtilisin-like protein [Anaeromyces robustus]|eukprot:ORX83213.1 subtilisin-like protein [Anaeromyces robustus]